MGFGPGLPSRENGKTNKAATPEQTANETAWDRQKEADLACRSATNIEAFAPRIRRGLGLSHSDRFSPKLPPNFRG
jgi:hypothetical protein